MNVLDRTDHIIASPGLQTTLPTAGRDFNAWAAAMSRGEFEAAWRVNDRSGRHWPSAHRLWRGEGIRGKTLIVRSLHGLGDTIQMLQYAPRLHDAGAKVIYEVQPALLPLMTYFRGVERAASWTSPPCDSEGWDAQTEIMELPYLFRTAVSHLPLATGYLRLPHALRSAVGHQMGIRSSLRVGVLWSGGAWDPKRWLTFELLRPLLAHDRIELWNLQERSTAGDAGAASLRDIRPAHGSDLLPYAALIANLDLVITPDTLAAHLAGAMGIPAWIMLQHEHDWRWMRHRTDTPWYPSSRLFRQPAPGAWREVVAAMEDALECLVSAQNVRQPLAATVSAARTRIQKAILY